MSRIYATRGDTDKQVLVEIKCDWCPATLKPGPHAVNSGWKKGGFAQVFGDSSGATVWDACPDHVPDLKDMVGTA